MAEVTDLVDQDQGIFVITEMSGMTFTLEAAREGLTELSVVALSPERDVLKETVTFEARTVRDVILSSADCDDHAYDFERLLVPPDTEITATVELRDGAGEVLVGDTTFEGDGLVPFDAGEGLLGFVAPSTPGEHAITTPVYDGTAGVIEVFDASTVDGFDLVEEQGPSPLPVGSALRLGAVALVDGEQPCLDALPRLLEIGTPDVCSLDESLRVSEATADEPSFHVYGIAQGTCVVTATLEGTTLSETVQIAVVP